MSDPTTHARKIAAIACILASMAFLYASSISATYINSASSNASNIIYYPDNISIVTGSIVYGNTNSIRYIDNDEIKIQESTASPAQRYTINFSNVTSFDVVSLIGGYNDGSGHFMVIRLWNWNFSQWDSFNIVTNTITVNNSYSITIPNTSNYIQPNKNVSIDLMHVGAGNTAHYTFWNSIILMSGAINDNVTVINNGGGGISFNGAAVDLNGSVLINGTFSNLNDTKVNKSGDTITGKLSVGILNTSISTRWNNISISASGLSTDNPGFDIMSTNAAGNNRAGFRITAGYSYNPDWNPNLPFTIFSNSHSSSPGLVRGTAWSSKEERFGVDSPMPNSTGWYSKGTHGNFTVYTVYQSTDTQLPATPSASTIKLLIDGQGNVKIFGLAGVGTRPLCAASDGTIVLCP